MKKHYRLAQTTKKEPVLFINGSVASNFKSIPKKYILLIAEMRGLNITSTVCPIRNVPFYEVKGTEVLLLTYNKTNLNRFIIKGK